MFGAAFKAVGFPHTYTPIDTPTQADLARMVRELRTGLLFGANVTLPHKKAVLELVDEVDPSASEVGAANVLVRSASGRVIAHNTDAFALSEEIKRATTARSRAVVIGAGGGALAAVAACKMLNFRVTSVTNRSWTSTEETHESPSAELLRKLGALTSPWPTEDRAVPSGRFSTALRLQWSELAMQSDVIIQATSAGMQGGPDGAEVASIVPWSRVVKGAVAIDLVYRPRVTPFLRAAEAAGIKPISGLGMLVEQAEETFRIWTRTEPPEGVMLRAATETLVATTA